jgi:23S rRNA (uracil1939-C5)-methyltransferase
LNDGLSCPHRPPCPGCPRFGAEGIAPAAQAALNELARIHGLPKVVADSGQSSGYRLRARLAIRGRLGSPKLGLFAQGTHRVVHIPACRVQHPLINRVAAVVRRALVEARVTCYSDKAHLGLARYLQVTVERSSLSAQVVIAANCATPEPLAACFELIRDRLGPELHSLWFNANEERSNTIFGPRFQNWCGPASIVDRFGGPAVHYPPGAFIQNNLEIAERIIAHVRTRVPLGSRVAEFYAGSGAIGLSLLSRAGELCLNEINPHALEGLELGLAELDAAMRARIRVLPGAAGAALAGASDAEVIIADPPRKGLDPELTQYLAEKPPQRFIYVSCDLESLRSDIAGLVSRGTLRLCALRAFNLLPFTEHVETVAEFARGSAAS